MLEKITILDRLEIFAESGLTEAMLKLWNNQIERLRRDGFEVTIIAPTERKGEYYCKIDWKNPAGQTANGLLATSIATMKKVEKKQ